MVFAGVCTQEWLYFSVFLLNMFLEIYYHTITLCCNCV